MATEISTPASHRHANALDLRHARAGCAALQPIRALVRETRLSPEIFIYPLFVCEGEGVRREMSSMPGVFHLSVDEAVKEATAANAEGIPGVLLFGLPDHKDDVGSGAVRSRRRRCRPAIRAIKREVAGHAGRDRRVPVRIHRRTGTAASSIDDEIANDPTVEQLVRAALSHAAAGADIVAPSDMMDGRVGAIRAGARRARVRASGDHVVRGEVLLRVLRSVPRRGGFRTDSSATGARTRWIRRTSRRRCARWSSTSRKARTS